MKIIAMDASKMEKLLQEAINSLPDNDESITLFGKAYLFRRLFEDLAENERDYNPNGIVRVQCTCTPNGQIYRYTHSKDFCGLGYALSKALSLSIGFEVKTVYDELERGIEKIPNILLPKTLPDNFKRDLCAIVSDLSPYTVKTFFESLEWAKLDYNDPLKLQWAVSESLHNYARVAALGTGLLEKKKFNYQRGRGKIFR